MSNMGYINYGGIDCIYSEKGGVIDLIAKDDKFNRELRALSFNKNYMIEYDKIYSKKCYAYINDAMAYFNGYMKLYSKYTFEMVLDKPVTHMEIIGDDIDMFFNPAKFFFNLSKEGTKEISDVVYSKENADLWKVSFNKNDIEIRLSYGDILRDGIKSDLKLHPKLTLSFSPTNDWEYLYELYSMVVKLLQIVLYKKTHGKFEVGLCTTDNGHISYIGQMFDYESEPSNVEKECREINYNNYCGYLERFWLFVANNPDYNINHLPNTGLRFSDNDYTQLDLLYIFTAFEKECDSEKKIYNSPDDTHILKIKEKLLSKIGECDIDNDNKEEKKFFEDIQSIIKGRGKSYGQEKKITNAYNVLSKIFENSLENILYEHKQNIENTKLLADKEIKKIAKFLCNERGKVAHSPTMNKFSNKDAQFIRFFEILTYSMMLKRAKFNEDEIEMIIGAVFYCNYKMFSKIYTNIYCKQHTKEI